ncbi:MAG: methyltransferase domain-containing protein [Chitinophagaceae bacterium]|nr:methyltransferase domain-containing protein [Chitinophagaceae bacterium]
MAGSAWYEEWFDSPYYHKLYFERDEKEAEAFILSLTGHLQLKPGSRVLDVACGKGRHSRILARPGADVTGIDISPSAITFAGQFENETLHFFVHDMRLPFWGNYFDYAFNFFTSFGYFRTRREHDAAIRTMARSLKPGALLVMDYLNVHYTEDHLVSEEVKELDGTIYTIKRWQDVHHFYNHIVITDPLLKTPLAFTERVAKFSFGDFTDMFSFQGMQVQEVFGDYALGSYDVKRSPRLIIVAKKITGQPADKEKRLYSDGRTGDALT